MQSNHHVGKEWRENLLSLLLTNNGNAGACMYSCGSNESSSGCLVDTFFTHARETKGEKCNTKQGTNSDRYVLRNEKAQESGFEKIIFGIVPPIIPPLGQKHRPEGRRDKWTNGQRLAKQRSRLEIYHVREFFSVTPGGEKKEKEAMVTNRLSLDHRSRAGK